MIRKAIGVAALLLLSLSSEAGAQITGDFAVVLDTSATVTVAQAQVAAQTAVAWLREVTWGRLMLTPVVYGPLSLGVDCSEKIKVRDATDAALLALGAPRPFRAAAVLSGCPAYVGEGQFGGRHIILDNNFGVLAHEVGHTFTLSHNYAAIDPG